METDYFSKLQNSSLPSVDCKDSYSNKDSYIDEDSMLSSEECLSNFEEWLKKSLKS